MLLISASDAWKAAHPGAMIGLLEVSNVVNACDSKLLDDLKKKIEEGLRARYKNYTRSDLIALPVMAAYVRYYKRFQKTYHVLLQLESIVHKGKSLPSVSPLVDANFSAELETLVLTAGHDASSLAEPIMMDVSRKDERMVVANGTEKSIQTGDMVMRDAHGVRCAILYGQDKSSLISPASTHVLYVSYAPPGVPVHNVEEQLNAILSTIKMFSPHARVNQQRIIQA